MSSPLSVLILDCNDKWKCEYPRNDCDQVRENYCTKLTSDLCLFSPLTQEDKSEKLAEVGYILL